MSLDGLWGVTDHVCRHCLGRILERNGRFVCSNCEATGSLTPKAICGCGMKPPKGTVLLPGRAGQSYHCGPNPERGPDNLAAICVLYGGKPVTPLDGKPT